MKQLKLNDFHRGWLIGCFPHSLVDSSSVEVGIQHYKYGDKHTIHYHKLSKEINVIVNGNAVFISPNGNLHGVRSGDIFIIDENEAFSFHALSDTTVVCIKTKAVPNDKYDGVPELEKEVSNV